MNSNGYNARGRWIVGMLAVLALLIIAGVALWFTVPRPAATREVASAAVVADFFTSLAALDVEENERAARILTKAIELQPGEPALWANRAVAYLRLSDIASARASVGKASSLDPDARELAVLRAEVLQEAGEIEPAIEQLRQVHQRWPENLAATYSLVTLLRSVRSKEAEEERLSLLSDILARAPGNLRAQCERARVAATLQRGEVLRAALDALLRSAPAWPEAAQEHLKQADEAAAAQDYRSAGPSITFFENLLKPLPEYQQSLAQLGVSTASAVGTPLRHLLRLRLPPPEAAEADVALEFEVQELFNEAARPDFVLALEQAGARRSTLLSLSGNTLRVGESAALPFPGSSNEANSASMALADLNFDFRQDLILVGTEGCRIFLAQEDGSFLPQDVELREFEQPWHSVWAVDVEADGDLDLLLSDHQSPLRWIRNNGDMTFTAVTDFPAAPNVVQLQAIDFDADGDVDLATLDTSGKVVVWQNKRGGKYVAAPAAFEGPRLGLAAGDVDRDAAFDLVSFSATGELRKASCGADGIWSDSRLLKAGDQGSAFSKAEVGEVFLAVADLDDNGAVDLIASTSFETAVWLRTAGGQWTRLTQAPPMHLTALADADGNGLLDFVGISEQRGRVALNRSQAGYGWHFLEPRANPAAGDKRINPFGIGGRIDLRAGNLVQAAAIQSPRVHFGLGRHKVADVARIVWPNGTVQAEFDLQTNETLVAEQRLKGSCPWVFAFDGNEFRFVKDFLWRSPLGLRINAQATAGVVQTEDWIKIPGDQLSPVNSRYLLRITAELWETHFFDHVAMLAVDHPSDIEVFVDERFVPNAVQARRVVVATSPRPLLNVNDESGNPLNDALRATDGMYADGFALGASQGVAAEHWVEFDLPSEVSADRSVLLVGNGWVYPTDSSLNVALSQGSAERPFGLILEQSDSSGAWHVLDDNLGFPGGKNKDVVIALPAQSLATSRRFRLRTNTEVYWDSLGWSYELPDEGVHITRQTLEIAELRGRGYSKLAKTDRRRPDIPAYEVAARGQRWLDLEGFYTRFGDVRDLLATVDDRYVIMNAGDELAFEFGADGDPPSDMRRDFVLVGDGWVKDGDFNTAYSRWVRPLPAHDVHDYAGPLVPLERDPVYLRHPEDWRLYHTRFVTARRFAQQLWQLVPARENWESKP